MKQVAISGRIQKGYAKAALTLGVAGQQYRPVNPLAPMAQVHAKPFLAFDSDPEFSLARPLIWGAVTEYVLTDRAADTAVGDIFICGTRTYFVSTVEPLRPVGCILCNRTISISGVTGTQLEVVAGCPAAIEMRAKGEASGSGIPGSTRPGQFILFLPLLPGVTLQPYMTVSSDLGATYSVNAVEHSDFGIRALMSMQQV